MTPIEEVRGLLHAAASDTQYRTVTSRAYYAAFTLAMAFAQPLGFAPDHTGADHQRLITFLTQNKNQLLHRIGKYRLTRLRRLRNSADYDVMHPFTEGMAIEAVQTAEEVIGWLESMTPPNP